jgi:threonine synthase
MAKGSAAALRPTYAPALSGVVFMGMLLRDPADIELASRPRNEAAREGMLAQPATTGASPQRTDPSVQQKRENG